MLELAKRLSLRTPEQTEEIEALIKNHKRDGIYVEENDGNLNIWNRKDTKLIHATYYRRVYCRPLFTRS